MINPSITMAQRYMGIIVGLDTDIFAHQETFCHKHLLWMCDQIEMNALTWPEDKTGRWLGFVQGILTAQNAITVNEERDISRPLFHQHYEKQNKIIPETIDRA